jgi:uncharacterized protein YfaT (DUF1175 family)
MAIKDYLSHDELQHIEHVNKVLEAHLDLVNTVFKLSEDRFAEITRSFSEFVIALKTVQMEMGRVVTHIYQSARDVRQATGGIQEITAFTDAIEKLDKILDDKLIEKLRKFTSEEK